MSDLFIQNFRGIRKINPVCDVVASGVISAVNCQNVELKNKINIMPLECAIGAVNAKLDSVIGCAGVRTCGSSCGNSCGFPNYAVPPVGTFNIQKSYNPNIPTAGA